MRSVLILAVLAAAAPSLAWSQSTAMQTANPQPGAGLVCRLDPSGAPQGCAASPASGPVGPAQARGPLLDAPAALGRPDARPLQPRFVAAPPAEAVQAALAPVAEAAPDRRARAVSDCRVDAGGRLDDCRAVSGGEAAQAAARPLLAQFGARPDRAGQRVTVALTYVAE